MIDAGYGLGQIQSEDPEKVLWAKQVLDCRVHCPTLGGTPSQCEQRSVMAESGDKALLALKRMGKEERLRAIAADPRNPAREAAELVLASKRVNRLVSVSRSDLIHVKGTGMRCGQSS